MVGGGESALRRRQNRAAVRVVFGGDQRQPAAGVGTHALGHRREGERSPAEGVVSPGSHAADGRCVLAASAFGRTPVGASAPMGRMLAGRSFVADTAPR